MADSVRNPSAEEWSVFSSKLKANLSSDRERGGKKEEGERREEREEGGGRRGEEEESRKESCCTPCTSTGAATVAT